MDRQEEIERVQSAVGSAGCIIFFLKCHLHRRSLSHHRLALDGGWVRLVVRGGVVCRGPHLQECYQDVASFVVRRCRILVRDRCQAMCRHSGCLCQGLLVSAVLVACLPVVIPLACQGT